MRNYGDSSRKGVTSCFFLLVSSMAEMHLNHLYLYFSKKKQRSNFKIFQSKCRSMKSKRETTSNLTEIKLDIFQLWSIVTGVWILTGKINCIGAKLTVVSFAAVDWPFSVKRSLSPLRDVIEQRLRRILRELGPNHSHLVTGVSSSTRKCK